MRATLQRLRRENEGATIVEFALCAPILLVALMGIFDLGHNMYTSAILNGAIQKAARDSTIDGASSSQSTLDGKVTDMVQIIAPGSTTSFERNSYTTFSDVAQPEDYDDVNGDGSCNDGEPFEDANGNGTWDANRGTSGFGGARDAVMYVVTVEYPRLFPIGQMIGQDDHMTLVVSTVLRNQPYSIQATSSSTGSCA